MTWGGGHKGEGGAFLVSYGEGPHVSQGAGGIGEGGNGMWDPPGGAPGGGGILRVLLGAGGVHLGVLGVSPASHGFGWSGGGGFIRV